MDDVQADTINVQRFIDKSQIRVSNDSDHLFITNIKRLFSTESYFFVVTHSEPFVYLFNKEGDFLSNPVKKGKGPGEVTRVTHAAANDQYIFLTDGPGARVNVYNSEINYEFMMQDLEINYQVDLLDLFLKKNRLFFPTPHGSDELIIVIELFDNDENNQTFLPKLIPRGMQPMAVNFHSGTVDFNDNIYVSYKGLPYVIQYDENLNPQYFLEFKENAMVDYVADLKPQSDSGTGVGVSDIIVYLEFISDDILITSTFRTVSVLKRLRNGGFEVLSRFVLRDIEEEGTNNIIYLEKFTFDDDYLYLTSNHNNYVYRVEMESIW